MMGLLAGWKPLAIGGALVVILSGVVWAQYQRVDNLKTQRDTLRTELTVAHDMVAQAEKESEQLSAILTKRENERRLLYAEVNRLKKDITQLEDAAAVDWLATDIPESIRLLREDHLSRQADPRGSGNAR